MSSASSRAASSPFRFTSGGPTSSNSGRGGYSPYPGGSVPPSAEAASAGKTPSIAAPVAAPSASCGPRCGPDPLAPSRGG
eukprot:3960297-Alexandrium_andersonii.AAC.1